jgi:hypothetical protein
MRELRQHGRAIANAGNSHYPDSTRIDVPAARLEPGGQMPRPAVPCPLLVRLPP